MNRHSKIRENERRIRQQQQRVKHRKGKAAARSRPPTPWRPFKKTRAWVGRCRRPLQVSAAEVRRFFVALLWPKVRQLASVLHWSNWRRNHQAQFFHYKTRKALRHLQL
jgi:hypothetical protein